MPRTKLAILTTLVLSQASLAATPLSGPYMRAFGGFAFTPNNINAANFTNSNYRTGYDVGGNLGYKSGPIRYELEGTYIHTKVKQFTFRGVRQTALGGKARNSSLMLNLFYDFEDFNASLAPYLGVGMGYSHTALKFNSRVPTVSNFSRGKYLFSYQGQIGSTYNFSENIAMDLGYRYFRTKKSNRLGKAYQAHLANFGVIYRFEN